MNAFDFIVTVALGSTLATILLSKDTPLAEGVVALGTLIFLQYFISWLSVRSKTVMSLVKAEPRLLFHRGRFLPGAMKSERINEEEVLQAVRREGFSDLEKVEAVVLETDGSLSIIQTSSGEKTAALSNVIGIKSE